MKTKTFKCPLCGKTYVEKNGLYGHLDNKHKEQLEGLTPAHWFFDWRHKNTTHKGKCVICRNETSFNEKIEKYERFCSEKCKKAYVEEFRKRMMKKYGKTTLLNDPEFQKKMLKNRKISGVYTWSDGTKFDYVGSYEKDCLMYLDKVIHYPSKNVFFPAPMCFKYENNGKEHFYIPDGYLDDINLIIEIKASDNKHYRERDIDIEKIKDSIFNESGSELQYNYIKVFDKKYDELLHKIEELKEDN